MNDEPQDSLKARLQRIRDEVRKSPMPPQEITPRWMKEGLEEASDFWNRMADVWDEFCPGLAITDPTEGSCLTVPFGHERFDYVVSRLTVHHFPPEEKLPLYRKIREALKPRGRYIEVDQSTTEKNEQEVLRFYKEFVSTLPGAAQGAWNYDITMSVSSQRRLLRDAGFSRVELCWEDRENDWSGMALFLAERF